MNTIHPEYLRLLSSAAEQGLLPSFPNHGFLEALGLMSEDSNSHIGRLLTAESVKGFSYLDDTMSYVSIAVLTPKIFLNRSGMCYPQGVSRFVKWIQTEVLCDYLVEDHTPPQLEKLHNRHLHKACPWFARSGCKNPKSVPFHTKGNVKEGLIIAMNGCAKRDAIFHGTTYHLVLRVKRKQG